MIQDFFKNSAIYGIGKFIALALGFVTIPIITNSISISDYGIFDLLNLCLVLLNLSVAMEISQAVARFMIDAKDPLEKRSYVSTAYFFSLGMFSIFAIILYFTQEQLSQFIFKTSQENSFIIYLIPWLFLHGTNTFISNQFRWENKPKKQVLLQAFMSVSLLMFVVLFLNVFTPSLQNLIHAYLYSQSFTAVLGFLFVFNHKIINLSFSMSKLRKMILFSLPLVPSSLAVFSQSYIDRIMISQVMNLEALGIYALSFKIASLLTVFSGIFQLSIVPLIYENHSKKNAPRDFGESALIYLFFMFSCVIGITAFTPELFHYFIGKDFYESAPIIPWLLLAICFQSFYIFAPGLAIKKKTVSISLLNFVGMFINFGLNILFIQYWGIIGVAIATMISALIMCIINIVISQRNYFIIFNYKKIILSLCIAITSIIAFNLTSDDINIENFIFKSLYCGGMIVLLGSILIKNNLKNFRI